MVKGYYLPRKKNRANLYRDLIRICCYPNCGSGLIECHHLEPLDDGGEDTFENYICLCKKHHYTGKKHSNWEETIIELRTYKFYAELTILGFTSDIPDKDFLIKVAEYKANLKK